MTWQFGLRYGLMGLPLAFVALPLYVVLPNFYAKELGVSLTSLGAILLLTRLLDALIDPFVGRWSDRLYQQSAAAVLRFGALACVLLGLGFSFLFMPLVQSPERLLIWCSFFLMLTYAAFSAVTVAHQSWGALLGGGDKQQGFIVAWREGLGLLGVVLASIAPALWGMPVTAGLFWMALLLGWLAWQQSARPQMQGNQPGTLATGALWLPFRRSAFRRLLGVFVLNGIASAVPATLVLFFIQDRLLASKAMEPVFLGTFFLSAALSMPLWLKAVARMGLAQAWLLGMLLSVLVFVWASQLQAGDVIPFLVICLLSGLALGADLALPGAMLARVIARAGDLGLAQGAYFGWWNFATKLNLAVAAGVALPVLGLFGYVAGAKDPKALFALTVAYCVLPCILKCLAALSLYLLVIRPARSQETDETS